MISPALARDEDRAAGRPPRHELRAQLLAIEQEIESARASGADATSLARLLTERARLSGLARPRDAWLGAGDVRRLHRGRAQVREPAHVDDAAARDVEVVDEHEPSGPRIRREGIDRDGRARPDDDLTNVVTLEDVGATG